MNYVFKPKPFSTLLAIVATLGLLALGTWQMSRFFEKSEEEDAWTQRRNADPIDVRSLSDLEGDREQQTAFAYGTIDPDRFVVVMHQRVYGKSGCLLINPMTLEGGGTVPVIRGFIPVSEPPRCNPSVASVPDGSRFRTLIHHPDLAMTAAAPSGRFGAEYLESLNMQRVQSAFGIDPIADDVVLVLHADHSGDPLPVASFDYTTAPYLTSMRHLNYAGTWYFSILIIVMLWGYRSLDKVPEAEPAT